jgi:hypothetical protein
MLQGSAVDHNLSGLILRFPRVRRPVAPGRQTTPCQSGARPRYRT